MTQAPPTQFSRRKSGSIGVKTKRTIDLILADVSVITRPLSEAVIEIPGYGEYTSPVLLGEEGDENLLGTVTLEIFGLLLDPLKRKLRPMRIVI